MKRIIKSNKKLNNKGFTLVEVLIAMSVLVIVSIPMLDTLSGTTVMTRKSSTRQRATLLGQSITEGIKRYSTLDLCRAFIATGSNKVDNFPILNGDNYTFADFARLNEVIDDEATGAHHFEVNSTESENARGYYFGIFGIEEGIEKYDALITLTPETYNDLNSEVIPEIVNIGAPGTGLIDITGVYNGKDILNEFKEKVGTVETYNPDKVKVEVDVYIKKHMTPEIMYETYGSVVYQYDTNGDGIYNEISVMNPYLGSRSLDKAQRLNYLYVLLGDSELAQFEHRTFNLRVHVNVPEGSREEAENIPIALVTGDNNKVKWSMNVDCELPNPDTSPGAAPTIFTDTWKQTAMFFTNDKDDKINFRNPGGALNDYATSGNKLKRIYGLTIDIYDYVFAIDRKFQGEPIDSITSSYLRIDVEDFNSQTSKAE